MITAEVAVYPLKTSDATGVINNSIDVLKGSTLEYDVNSMNTRIVGKEEDVFNGLMSMFRQAEKNGEISMVVTITNSAG